MTATNAMTTRPAATYPRPFVPLSKLPGVDLEPGPLEPPEFVARQVTILEARRRQGMNLVVADQGGRVLRIAPDGTETDVTAELDRTIRSNDRSS
ncbi:MAG: hypothetical protein ACU0CI_03950 [Shimia sp.]